jgi:hypothetical protein
MTATRESRWKEGMGKELIYYLDFISAQSSSPSGDPGQVKKMAAARNPARMLTT